VDETDEMKVTVVKVASVRRKTKSPPLTLTKKRTRNFKEGLSHEKKEAMIMPDQGGNENGVIKARITLKERQKAKVTTLTNL
jgi:hypothetical protein